MCPAEALVEEIRRVSGLEGWEAEARGLVGAYAVGGRVEVSALVRCLDRVLAALERQR